MEIGWNTVIVVITILISIGSTFGYLKSKLDYLIEEIKKQNGSIHELNKWIVEHMQFHAELKK